jgi:hypothetical protein
MPPKILSFALTICFTLAIAVAAGPAGADVPNDTSYQGRLLDNNGDPLPGPVDIAIRIFPVVSGGSPLYQEIHQNVPLRDGVFNVVIGAGDFSSPPGGYNPSAFSGMNRWLEVEVESEVLQPRQPFHAVPYAFRAAVADVAVGLPTGSVIFFDGSQCPAGWSPLDAARGRVIVGLPQGGTVKGTVGPPLTDLQDRGHAHSVDPPRIDTTNDTHNHIWGEFLGGSLIWRSFTSGGSTTELVNWENGMDTAGAGHYPLSRSVNATRSYYTNRDTHGHSVDIGAVNSTGANISHVIPYIQLLVCRKD